MENKTNLFNTYKCAPAKPTGKKKEIKVKTPRNRMLEVFNRTSRGINYLKEQLEKFGVTDYDGSEEELDSLIAGQAYHCSNYNYVSYILQKEVPENIELNPNKEDYPMEYIARLTLGKLDMIDRKGILAPYNRDIEDKGNMFLSDLAFRVYETSKEVEDRLSKKGFSITALWKDVEKLDRTWLVSFDYLDLVLALKVLLDSEEAEQNRKRIERGYYPFRVSDNTHESLRDLVVAEILAIRDWSNTVAIARTDSINNKRGF